MRNIFIGIPFFLFFNLQYNMYSVLAGNYITTYKTLFF